MPTTFLMDSMEIQLNNEIWLNNKYITWKFYD